MYHHANPAALLPQVPAAGSGLSDSLKNFMGYKKN